MAQTKDKAIKALVRGSLALSQVWSSIQREWTVCPNHGHHQTISDNVTQAASTASAPVCYSHHI